MLKCGINWINGVRPNKVQPYVTWSPTWEYPGVCDIIAYLRVSRCLWHDCLPESIKVSVTWLPTWEYPGVCDIIAYLRVSRCMWHDCLPESIQVSVAWLPTWEYVTWLSTWEYPGVCWTAVRLCWGRGPCTGVETVPGAIPGPPAYGNDSPSMPATNFDHICKLHEFDVMVR